MLRCNLPLLETSNKTLLGKESEAPAGGRTKSGLPILSPFVSLSEIEGERERERKGDIEGDREGDRE